MTQWNNSTVGEIADTQLGKMLNKSKQSGKHSKPYLRTDNVHWGRFDLSEIKEMDIFPAEEEKYLATKGDLLMCEGGASGRTAIWNEEYDISFQNHVHRIRPKNLCEIAPKYLLYYFEWFIKNGFASELIKGVTISSLSQSGLRSIQVTYPAIDKQHKIVEILEDHLSRLDAALADVKRAKLKAAKFRSRFIQELLSRELLESVGVNKSKYTERLGDYFDFQSGFAYKSAEWIESGVPVVKIMNVKNRLVNLEGCSFISTETAKSTVAFAVSRGDLLFNMTGATLGVFGFYESDSESRMNQRVGKFIPKSENASNLKYLAYFLESFETQVAVANLAKGAAQPNISPTDILSIPIHMPNHSEQLRISSYLDANLSRVSQTTLITRQIELQANALRRSLLQAAFTGQLTKEEVNV